MASPTLEEFRASDGCTWKYRRFAPGGTPRGAIAVLHGIQSHGGWYLGSSAMLAERGWEVVLLDRRGSGLNEVDRGDAPSFRRLLDDIAEFLPTLPKPRVLVGVSWGGKLAVALERRHPGLSDRLVLIGPGIRPKVHPPMLTRVRILAARFVSPQKRFAIPLIDPTLFTGDESRQQFIAADALSLHQATARLLVESARLDFYLRKCPKCVSQPTLVLLAGQDRIIDNAKTRRYVGRFRGLVDVIEYPNAHHTLEFEPGGPPFLDDLSAWINGI